MNIFEALSQGKGRINEETMSAMLAYFLNPAQTHGVGDTFLRRFLHILADELNQPDRFDDILKQEFILSDVFLEERYELKENYDFPQKSRTVDIEVRLYLKEIDDNIEQHRIIIENKIRHVAAQDDQLKQEFIGVRDRLDDDDEHVNITVVFLTPYGNQASLTTEYETLSNESLQSHKKTWIRWHDDNEASNNITNVTRYILEHELRGDINPISEYVRHTLKAFAFYIENRVSPIKTSDSHQVGDVKERVSVTLKNGTSYIIERYVTKSVRVFQVEDNNYVSLAAKPTLIEIARDKDLGDDILYRSTGNDKSVRMLGRDIIQELVRRGLND